jgi:hypothetical protein
MRLACVLASLALAACASGGAAAPAAVATPAPVETIAPVGLGAPKIPLRGLIDMQDISWHNTDNGQPAFDIANVDAFPGLFGGIVINATWSQMQPTINGPIDRTAVDAALGAVRAYNSANASAPLGVKLRIYGGSNAPAWAKSIDGPIRIFRNPAGCGGVVDSCLLTVGAFWTPTYISSWRSFLGKVAAIYDAEPLIRAVAVTSCAAQTDEPFVATSGPTGVAHLKTAGYTDDVEQACLSGAVDDYAAWTETPIDFTFNAFEKVDGGVDAGFTKTVMSACRTKLGGRCILDNHALQTPLTADLAIYAAIKADGAPINFQTASPEGMGCIWPETITQGLILGARAIEVWPKFQGFTTLTMPQVQALRDLFSAPVPASTPAPNPLPTPCSGYN